MIRLKTVGLATAFAIICVNPSAHANNLRNCIGQIVGVDVGNKNTFQAGLRDLIIREAPQYGELATLNWELQAGLVEKRQRELQYLLFTDPERLDVKRTVSKLTNYDWNELDTIRMARVAPEYKALTERLDGLQLRNNNHSDWPELRTYITTTLVENADYSSLLQQLQKGQDLADRWFKDCRGS